MMNLYLLRHGPAEERAASIEAEDSRRRLTPEGRRKTRLAARGMKALGLKFDVIVTSPYPRARQTAEIVARVLKHPQPLHESDHLVPPGNVRGLVATLNRLAPAASEILLVGHEPFLSGLISRLLVGDTRLGVAFKKAGLCKLAVTRLRSGQCATLHWLLTPRQLASIR